MTLRQAAGAALVAIAVAACQTTGAPIGTQIGQALQHVDQSVWREVHP